MLVLCQQKTDTKHYTALIIILICKNQIIGNQNCYKNIEMFSKLADRYTIDSLIGKYYKYDNKNNIISSPNR